jgi:transposase
MSSRIVSKTTPAPAVASLVDALLNGKLTEAQAAVLAAAGEEAVLLTLMAANARIAALQRPQAASPSTPSAMVPVYRKPPAPRRKRKPGAKPGHPGSRRPAPAEVDRHVEHRLAACPCCGGAVTRGTRVRTRVIEDIPERIEPEVTEHTVHGDWCPNCRSTSSRSCPTPCPTPRWATASSRWPDGSTTAWASRSPRCGRSSAPT